MESRLPHSKINPSLMRFLEQCQRRRYPKKAIVFSPGDEADTLYYIIEGSVTVFSTGEEGRELVLSYLNAGEFMGEMGLFVDPRRRGVTCRTRTLSVLAAIKYQNLRELFKTTLREQQADILMALGRQLSDRLLHTSRQASRLAFLDVTGRIARTLLDLCEEPEAMTHPDGMQISVTRQEIGRIVGCSREVVGRVLKNLEQDGFIHARGKTMVIFKERECLNARSLGF
jgi:CRP/FNR family cyclic AMP-dependent transcriptional regulator